MKYGGTAFLICGLLLLSPLALGEVYKWVDEKGKVHFGDKAPNKQAETLKLKPSKGIGKMDTPSSGQDFRQIQQRLLDSYDAERAQKKLDQERTKQQHAKTLEKCAKAKSNYKLATDFIPVKADKDGNAIYLSSEEIDAERARLKNWISANCS